MKLMGGTIKTRIYSSHFHLKLSEFGWQYIFFSGADVKLGSKHCIG